MAGVLNIEGRVNVKVAGRVGWDQDQGVKGYICLHIKEFCYILGMVSQQHF